MYKKGKCLDCTDGKETYLIAGRCQKHYWQHRAKIKGTKPGIKSRVKKVIDDHKGMDAWFERQIAQIPAHCEECGKSLASWKIVMPRACVAHILPKRKTYGFPSVATAEHNRMFFCVDCHTNFDNGMLKEIKSLPLMRERFATFKDQLTDQELNRVPKYLL